MSTQQPFGNPWPVQAITWDNDPFLLSDQAEDWIWYPEGKAVDLFRPISLVEVAALPICQQCDQEVKPGEDLCWNCLGEVPEMPEPEYGPYFYQWPPTYKTSYVPINYTYTYPDTTTRTVLNGITIVNGDALTIDSSGTI